MCYDSLYICFIDYQKERDNVKYGLVLKRLHEIDSKRFHILEEIYYQQTAEVQVTHEITTEKFNVLKGICQDCILSPILFNVYWEKIFQIVLTSRKEG